MAYCRQCGTQIPNGASFCPSCGAKADLSHNTSDQYGYGSQAKDVEDNKLISILCYFGILLLIPLLTKPDSQFVKFHSNQGLVLFLLFLISGGSRKNPVNGLAIRYSLRNIRVRLHYIGNY
jgi:hypothetical protein